MCTLRSTTTRLVDRYAALVCDLDGVVYRGDEPVPHAVDVLSALPCPVLYATNNASRPPRAVARHLRRLGLQVADDQVVTSAMAGAAEVRDRCGPVARVLAVGGPGVREALETHGLVAASAGEVPVDAVLQGYGPDVTVTDLTEAAHAVDAGAVWVATNEDLTRPTERGTAPGNGTLVAAVRAATGVTPVVVGKPHPPLFLMAAGLLAIEATEILVVGDRLDTDIAGATAAGMDSVLVLTGVHGHEHASSAPPDEQPTHVIRDLRGLVTTDQPGMPCAAPSRADHRSTHTGAGDAH